MAPLPHAARRRWAALAVLVVQNSTLILCMRASRVAGAYSARAAVAAAELLKLGVCLVAVRGGAAMTRDAPCMAIPALLYTVQNWLTYAAIARLDAATFQVTAQLKIPAAALLSVAMLHRVLARRQWGALVALTLGVALVQLPHQSTAAAVSASPADDRLVGLLMQIAACTLSGLAGVYFEARLKSSSTKPVGLLVRNVQLAAFGLVFATAQLVALDDSPWFDGFTPLVWTVVVLNALGGLVVAAVVKYADTIVKGFATSLAIVCSAAASSVLWGVPIHWNTVAGAVLVVVATFAYSLPARQPKRREVVDIRIKTVTTNYRR